MDLEQRCAWKTGVSGNLTCLPDGHSQFTENEALQYRIWVRRWRRYAKCACRAKLAEMLDRSDPWRRFRVLKRVGSVSIIFFFLTIAFVVAGQINLRSHVFHLFILGWIWFGLVMVALTYNVRCPRCSQRFYADGADFSQVTTRCLHCGQEKYADLGTRSRSDRAEIES